MVLGGSVSDILSNMIAHIDISSTRLQKNVQALRAHSKRKIVGVVKANAYGVGMREVVQVLDEYVDVWAVDDVSELHVIRFLTEKDVYVMGYTRRQDILNMCMLRGIQCVYDEDTIRSIDSQARIVGEVAEVQLKIDALLCRQGVYVHEVESICDVIRECPYVRLRGVYAHFASLEDDVSLDHSFSQLHEYQRALDILSKKGFSDIETHISATAGSLINIDSFSHVRVGIGLYGVWPSKQLQASYEDTIKLQPVCTWKTYVAQVKSVQKGQSIGYGRTFVAQKNMKVAVIPQGYSDGYDRLLSNKGEVLINGKRCGVCGRVAMNMFVVDVSHLDMVHVEDEVVLLGEQGEEEIGAYEIADHCNTIPYEVLTRLHPLLERRVV